MAPSDSSIESVGEGCCGRSGKDDRCGTDEEKANELDLFGRRVPVKYEKYAYLKQSVTNAKE
jgi:hypothetical protein